MEIGQNWYIRLGASQNTSTVSTSTSSVCQEYVIGWTVSFLIGPDCCRWWWPTSRPSWRRWRQWRMKPQMGPGLWRPQLNTSNRSWLWVIVHFQWKCCVVNLLGNIWNIVSVILSIKPSSIMFYNILINILEIFYNVPIAPNNPSYKHQWIFIILYNS